MEIDLRLCTFCELKNTKYSYIECGIVVCNVCAVSVKSNYSGYDEELKKVGVCKKCSKKKFQSNHRERNYKKGYILCFKNKQQAKNNLII